PRRSEAHVRPAPALPRPVPGRICRPRGTTPDDRFFRQLVGSMRSGVIAIHRAGTLALVNDEAYRIFAAPRGSSDIGRPCSEIFHNRPELVRVMSSAFELSTLPNRAELRLKDL